MELVLETNCNDDSHEPQYLKVELTPADVARIKMLAGEVRRLGAYMIEEWDNSAVWYDGNPNNEEDKAEEVSVSVACRRVYDEQFDYTCEEKHGGGSTITTTRVEIGDLDFM